MGKNKPCPLPFTTDSENHWFETGEIKRLPLLWNRLKDEQFNRMGIVCFSSFMSDLFILWMVPLSDSFIPSPAWKRKSKLLLASKRLAGRSLWTCRDEESWFMGYYNDYWALTDSFGTHTSPCWKCWKCGALCNVLLGTLCSSRTFFPPRPPIFVCQSTAELYIWLKIFGLLNWQCRRHLSPFCLARNRHE